MMVDHCRAALVAAQRYAAATRAAVRAMVWVDGRLCADAIDQHQRAVHGYAWVETTVHALSALLDWADAVARDRPLNAGETALLSISFGEGIAQLIGGLPMGQNEILRPADMGTAHAARELADATAHAPGNTAAARAQLVAHIRDGGTISDGLGDDALDQIRQQYRRFTDERIIPHAHGWHRANALIPDGTIADMAALGTFGVCIGEEFGGLGLGKLVMCVVTEELSRGWIGAGSLGTRSEIAGELIAQGGTREQQAYWLPRIAAGQVLPTAVFTEPDTGSDMANLQTRATQGADGAWSITG
ncbi:MAG: acyl-CoA dehydrogenase family protein, partial [Sphingopyxis sp.]